MARVPGHVPQGTGLVGSRTGQWGEHPSQRGHLGGHQLLQEVRGGASFVLMFVGQNLLVALAG